MDRYLVEESRGARFVRVLVCVPVCRSELGVSGEKGHLSGTADECRSYISSRPPQTPEQWVFTPYCTISVEANHHASTQSWRTCRIPCVAHTFCHYLFFLFFLRPFSLNCSPSPQWWTDPGRSSGQEGFLEEDVQVSECCKRHQQPVRARHLGVHHGPLRHHHRPAVPIQIPPHFPAQETQAADR